MREREGKREKEREQVVMLSREIMRECVKKREKESKRKIRERE